MLSLAEVEIHLCGEVELFRQILQASAFFKTEQASRHQHSVSNHSSELAVLFLQDIGIKHGIMHDHHGFFQMFSILISQFSQ